MKSWQYYALGLGSSIAVAFIACCLTAAIASDCDSLGGILNYLIGTHLKLSAVDLSRERCRDAGSAPVITIMIATSCILAGLLITRKVHRGDAKDAAEKLARENELARARERLGRL